MATWKFAQPPEDSIASPAGMPCRRIGDHRRIYLDYQGPISGERGEVIQFDKGDCRVEVTTETNWDVKFIGGRLSGRFKLSIVDDSADRYELRFLGA